MNLKSIFFLTAQYTLPQHLLSRLLGTIARSKNTQLKNWLIRKAIAKFNIDLSEAASADINSYHNFNAFFTRALKPKARSWPRAEKIIASPADGAISQIGTIRQNQIFQAKGHDYSLEDLLAIHCGHGSLRHSSQTTKIADLINGQFATIYLSPRDYHRVHMPYDGKLTGMTYVPGKLFSVNPLTAAKVPNLFARNERVICWFETDFGPMVVIFVGAFFVASISTVWHGTVTPPHKHGIAHWQYDVPKAFKRGDELGHFEFGSTVIILMPKTAPKWDKNWQAGNPIQLGNLLTQ